MDFGSQCLGKVVGEDTLWVVLACKEATLGQMFPSYHVHHQHEPPPQEGSGSFTERIQQEDARDPQITPCLQGSLQHTFFHTGERGTKCKL